MEPARETVTRFLALATLFAILFLSTCQSALARVTEEQVNLDYVGMTEVVGIDRFDGYGLIDLSFSNGAWTQNSGRCFQRLQSGIIERQIITKVDTSLCSGESRKTEILLDSNLEGLYELIFRDPDGKRHPRGDLTLSSKLNP